MDPFTIPLIAEAIALHLGLYDLTQCVLVNKAWQKAFTRSLWESVDLDNSFGAYMYGAAYDEDEEMLSPVEPPPTPPEAPPKDISEPPRSPTKSPRLAQIAVTLRRFKRVMVDRCVPSKKRRDQHAMSSMDVLGKSTSDASTEAISLAIPTHLFTAAFLTGINANGQHIRQLRVTAPYQLPILLAYTPNLSSLVILVNNDSEWSAISTLANNKQIRLTSLEIIARTLPHEWWKWIAAFEHLESLRLVNQYDPFAIEDLIRSVWRCHHLRSLHLVGAIRANISGPPDSAGSSPALKCFSESLLNQIEPLRALTSVDLRFKDTGDLQDDFFVPFLKMATNVKRLFPPHLSRTQCTRFAQAIQTYCRQIERIDLTSMTQLMDADIAEILKACSRNSMRELLLTGSAVGAETMNAIAECHSGSMEKLTIEYSRSPVPSASIQQVLASCKRLKEFTAGNQGWKGYVRLDAADIIRSPWACTQHLETLAVCIVGCTSQSLHNAVFEQLARMTRLKSLDFTEMRNETQKQVDERGGSLAWTLDSGMTKLASLTQLEYVWLLGGHFDLGERERAWIYEHWPNINKSSGVW
ncbi:hypothetical protein BGZ73_003783 [Actinomortierella ambigua]|nr:hypothetical protein BGZ73_003783 [Actinomortierella ambigua]